MKVFGLETHFVEMGEGYPVVLLHGWGANSEAMLGLGRELSTRYHVVIPDLWGFGKSEPPTDFDVYAYAQAVVEFLDKLNLKRVSLVGHSFGGRLALIVAGLHSKRLEKLVLIDSAGVKPRFSLKKHIQILRYKKAKQKVLSGEASSNILDKFGSKDFKQLDKNMQKIFVRVVNEDLTPFLPKVEAKTLILWGKNDKETPRYMAKVLHKNLKYSMLKWLNGGHFAYVDSQKQALQLIFEFLEA